MSRQQHIIRPRKLTIHLPEDIAMRLELYLTSVREGKVPQGAYQRFFVDRINEFFAKLQQGKQT
jgi:hypothetical protein